MAQLKTGTSLVQGSERTMPIDVLEDSLQELQRDRQAMQNTLESSLARHKKAESILVQLDRAIDRTTKAIDVLMEIDRLTGDELSSL